MDAESPLKIPYLKPVDKDVSIAGIASAMDDMPKQAIAHAPWHNYPYKPDCAFAIAHADNHIFLKFYVTEGAVLARFTKPNSLVYKDSCVEFFIAFNNEDSYYNLEFNCLGTAYVGYGGSTSREVAAVSIVEEIESNSLLYSAEGKVKWELTLKIPVSVFYHHTIPHLLQGNAKCNFFKCGDDTPVPHYLCWNNITSEEPNFHLPQYFGAVSFSPLS